MKNKKILIIFSIIVLILMGFNSIVNADIGLKPSITVKLKNMKTTNYLIDLLVYDETGENYNSPLSYNGKNAEQYSESSEDSSEDSSLKTVTVEQLETLHKINYDGWISESTRWMPYLLFGDCGGNILNEHYFSYFGTPDTYKVVIINNDTGETKVTDVIHREDFSSVVTIDVDSMNVVSSANSEGFSLNIKNIVITLLLTIIVELVVALIMKIKNIKTIIIVNMITNLILQFILIYVNLPYLILFAIMEILVIISEFFVYRHFFKDISKNKILLYTLIANIITALLTFIIKL